MKKFLKFSAITALLILIVLGCQKTFTSDNQNKEFNVSFVKEWYYKTFQNTEEWKSTYPNDKKYPTWQNSTFYKIGNFEIIELPLIKEKTKLPIISSKYPSEADIKKVISASQTRVLFIKNNLTNEITIREVDYIPSWDYVQKKHFDISTVSFGKQNDDFTGEMGIKNWDGKIVSQRLLTNGKITHSITPKVASINTGNISVGSASSYDCSTYEICTWYEDCVVIGDSWTDDCGMPYMDTSTCEYYDVCTDTGDDGSEPDMCALYGIGCYNVPTDDPTDINGYKPLTSNNFRYNLGIKTNIPPPAGFDAHHVFPQGTTFTYRFAAVGININDPSYGTWWQNGPHQANAYAYNLAWSTWFDGHQNATASDILAQGKVIMANFGFTNLNY